MGKRRRNKAQPDPQSSDMDTENDGVSLLQSPCKNCNFTGVSLRKHLSKRPDCKGSYDVGELIELEVEAKIIKNEKHAERMRSNYLNDPEESPRKRTYERNKYHSDPEGKKEAERTKYFHDPEGKKEAERTKYLNDPE